MDTTTAELTGELVGETFSPPATVTLDFCPKCGGEWAHPPCDGERTYTYALVGEAASGARPFDPEKHSNERGTVIGGG